MSESLRRVLIVRVGEADPSRLARSLRDAGDEAILLDAPSPDPAHVVAVAVQEDVDEIAVVSAGDPDEPYLAALRAALTAADAEDIPLTPS